MKTETIRLLIVIFVLLTFASLILPPGQPGYRLKERVEAMEANSRNPSASTEAALHEEFARLNHHEAMVSDILLPSVLLVDIAVIYFFWNYGKPKTTA
jgi:hypothetical protein